ncbi:GMC oxidoreductase [Schizopora paradoxa]|uniref:GMC oxidoreductase n=1 Tax=Schizopora paradoxa TaxID=27342 RepID=A0A0H2RGT8_9AGAM|nr:GMC oxidoreductase [Schizopora paradoxa]
MKAGSDSSGHRSSSPFQRYHGMVASIDEISEKSFDYVVIGGGTAGLTVAARLSEDPNVTVAVLEAGSANFDDPLINVPAQFGRHFGNPKYDWCLETEPQKSANDQVYKWPRGKTLGGSSAINFFMWMKPPADDIDTWEKLGNPGWNATRYFDYSRKVESFHPPKDEAAAKEQRQFFRPEAHGYNGPLKTSFPNVASSCEKSYHATLSKLGIEAAKSPLGGDPIGSLMAVSTLDPDTHTRTYAATAYLPKEGRPNLRVLPDALVHRILLEGCEDTEVVAKGVEFGHGEKLHTVKANREVIVCGGALKSPQILELSGIGDKRILEPLGIKTIVHLPGVGANMQEHNLAITVLELNPAQGHVSLDMLANPEFTKGQLALRAEGKGMFCSGMQSVAFLPMSSVIGAERAKQMIQSQKEKIRARISAGEIPKSLQEQYKIQLERLESDNNGDCELILFPGSIVPSFIKEGRNCVTMVSAINLPFSRGTIHIKSADPHVQPAIDPNTFEDTFELDVLTETFKFNRKITHTMPWKDVISNEIFPGPDVATDEDIHNYLKKYLETTFHTIGTASMLPRELDGVVDPSLRVYGTKNIRVVDLSVVPLHIAAHTQATAYTIGEIAADIIKGKI